MCPTMDAFNAKGNLVGSPPIIINETILTLEHVMQRIYSIERKMLTEEHIENLDKRMHNLANKIGSKAGDALKLLKEKGPIVDKRVEESPAQIDKLEEIFSNLSSIFFLLKLLKKLLLVSIASLHMFLRTRVPPLVATMKILK